MMDSVQHLTLHGNRFIVPESHSYNEKTGRLIDQMILDIEEELRLRVYAAYLNENRQDPNTMYDLRFVFKKDAG